MKFSLKKILPKKILARLLIIFFVPLIFIQIFAIFLFYDRHWEKITTRFANIASNQINLIVKEYAKKGYDNSNEVAKNLNIKIKVIDESEMIDIQKSFNLVEKNIINTFESRINRKFQTKFKENFIEVYIYFSTEILKIILPKKYLVSETPLILFLWIIASSIILSLLAFLFLRIQVRAITRLANFSEKLNFDNDIKGFKPSGAIEVRMAGNAIIRMKKRIKNQIKSRTDFLAGISHDLGTLITRIKLQLELTSDLKDIKSVKQDVNSMQSLLKEYLDYSKNINKSEKTKNINLSSFFRSLVDSSKTIFKKKTIIINCNSEITIKVKENDLFRVCSNMLNNACKFGENIKIVVKKVGKKISINFEDDGPGIPEKNKKEIFKPFFKLDSSRNLNFIGSGLGLSIAKEITTRMNGKIIVQKSDMGGALFQILLPIN